MEFLTLRGYAQSHSFAPWSPLNMAVIVFFADKKRLWKATQSHPSSRWHSGIRVTHLVSFHVCKRRGVNSPLFVFLAGLERVLNRSRPYTPESTTPFCSWQLDTSSTRLLSFVKWVSENYRRSFCFSNEWQKSLLCLRLISVVKQKAASKIC